MKKFLLVSLVLVLSLGRLFAGPVDVKTAKMIGEKFVRANMETLRNFQSTKHVKTSIAFVIAYCLNVFC